MQAKRFWQGAGKATMVSIALAIQPLQYGLLAGAGRALAQTNCIPSPINHCTVPDPESPTITPQVKYLLLPGIGDSNPTYLGQSNYFNGTNLAEFLQGSQQRSTQGEAVSVDKPFADWRSKNLTTQGTELSSRLNGFSGSYSKLILVGHSMGGLRARQTMQVNARSLPKVLDSTKALVTIGTPNEGAMIIRNGKPAATLMGGVVGMAVGGFVGVPYLGAAAGMFTLRKAVSDTVDSPSGQDMDPDSAFIRNLNSGASPLPASLITLQIVGNNSNIDSYGASVNVAPTTQQVTTLRNDAATLTGVAGLMALAAGFFTFGATTAWGLALMATAYLLSDLPTFWRQNVMGGAEGDGVVTTQSQRLPATAGGGERLSQDLPFAVHTGDYGEYQTVSKREYTNDNLLRSRLTDVQARIRVPLSQ